MRKIVVMLVQFALALLLVVVAVSDPKFNGIDVLAVIGLVAFIAINISALRDEL